MFDGTKSVVFFPQRRAATIVQGRSEAPVGRELIYAYHFFSGSLDHLLDHAQRVSFFESSRSDELVIESSSHEGTIRVVVSPSRGCIIEQATAVGPTGEVLGVRKDARVVQVKGGPWFLVHGRDEVYVPGTNQAELMEKREFDVRLVSVNELMPVERFQRVLPPGTSVDDRITGRVYRIPSEVSGHPDGSALPDLAFGGLACVIVVGLVAALWRSRQRAVF